MTYNKCITNKGKDQVLKLAFLSDEAKPFKYCALGDTTSQASLTKNQDDFHEFEGNGYHRVEITNELIENNTLRASCVFTDDNYTGTGESGKIKEIGLCDSYDGDNSIYFAFSEVPKITKTDSVSLKYTWIINIE